MTRLLKLLGALRDYFASWRGMLVAAVVVIAITLTITTSANPVAVALAILALAAAPLLLLAHDFLRVSERIAAMSGTPSSGVVDTVDQTTPYPVVDPHHHKRPPDVSIVVTAFDEAVHLATCLESLRWQTHASWEAVVVDDGSTDRTREIALDYAATDPRIRVVAIERNSGLATARNVGLVAAEAGYVTFLDADDFLYPDAIAARLAAMPALADAPWCAGVYCNWTSVAENERGFTEPPFIAARGDVSWFDAVADAPFIASAPLLRRSVVEAVGGFPAVATAEDAMLWNTILRSGWSFSSVPYTGIAYRMKRVSMFRSAPILHTEVIESVAISNDQTQAPSTTASPFPFVERFPTYLPNITLVRRLIGALAATIEGGGDVDAVTERLRSSFETHHAWTIDLDTVVLSAARRVTNYLGSSGEVAFNQIRTAVNEIVDPLRDRARDEVLARLADHTPQLDPSQMPRWRECSPVHKSTIPPALLSNRSSPVRGRLVMLPTANYHVDEAGPLAEALTERGIESVVMASERRWEWIRHSLAGYKLEVVDAAPAGGWLADVSGVLTFNDWGEYGHDYVVEAKTLDTPTFAKVEGVQDFADVDVHWDRKAYQWADLILAQGQNDVTALPDQKTEIVGSTRLERIWLTEPRRYQGDLLVLNLNFTYGVLDDARDLWLSTAVAACERSGTPYVVSLHPAERDRYEGRYPVADAPMRHLLTKASVLVSRFSTVPFEAMARGVPFIYHNPHGEQVPAFRDPDGAFEVSDDVRSLTAAIYESRAWVSNYRQRAADFFARQIDVDRNVPPEQRAAAVIASHL